VGDKERALESLREAIDRFGEELAPEVVARARTKAVERASSILAESMAQSLLDHARSQLAPSPSRSPVQSTESPVQSTESPAQSTESPAQSTEVERSEPPPEEPPELAHYVYGVAWAGEDPLPEGHGGVDADHPPFMIEHGSLSAIASLVPLAEFDEEALRENLNDVGWLERKARAHELVLDEALASMTVVPLRLCTIYRNEDQVREMLGRERGVFEDALRRLEGKTEWGVKLLVEPGALERASSSPGESQERDELSPGAAYMRERSREAQAREDADRVAEEWADYVHGLAASKASEALLNPLQNPEVSGHTGEMLLNGVYLVDESAEKAFRMQVAALTDEFRERGASVELTGPWPPYNFVKGSIEAAR
jgi:Gas vesicle synthesis protein GvpL/GvpF